MIHALSSAPRQPDRLASDSDLDRRFRDMTARGSRALADGDGAAATASFRSAWEEARAQFDRARSGCAAAAVVAPMMLVVAGHNLAQGRALTGETAATDTATEAAERLIAAAACPASPLALRLNCVRHLRHAFGLLIGRGDEAEAVATVRSLGPRVAEVAAEVVRVAGLCRGSSLERPGERTPMRS